MKKIAILISCILISIFNVAAQNNSFGVKAGANLSSNILSKMDGETSMKAGFEVGGFLKHDFGKYFAIQPELLISMQNSDYKFGSFKQDYRNWGLNIPIYALGQLTTDEGHRAYIGVGPDLGVCFGGKEKVSGDKLYKDGALMNRFDVGASALVGYEFDFGMQVNLSYRYGFFNALKNPADDAMMHRNCATLGLGWRF